MKIKEVALGYCQNCRRAAPVGVIELPGWSHQYNICTTCLRYTADIIDQRTQRILEDYQRNVSQARG